MAELSIEAKAKAYDEAKARMSRAFNSNRCTIGFMNEIFPELKESEDERIRKKLLALIEWSKSYAASGITTDEAKKMTAWLEKHEQNYQGKSAFEAVKEEKVDNQNCVKPADKVEPSTFRNKLLELFQNFRWICKDQILTNGEILEYVDAHIQELIGTIQKPAWSEEELDSITAAINNLEYLKNNYVYHQMGLEPAITFLKSLKDRYTWKPSDGQIKVCKEVYADLLSAKGFDLGTVNSELNRLEEQLKKLREEYV